MKDIDIIAEAKRVLRVEARAVADMGERLGPEFERAARMIHETRGKVIVSGMGKSGLIGKKIAATLASTGTPSFFMHPAEASHGDLGMVTRDDTILALSNSGETSELICLIPYLKRFSVNLISMTGNPASTLATTADVNLDVSVSEEACPMDIVPTASTTAALAMGDALAVALLVMRGLDEEGFAALHPAGALGKKLLVKVSDLMHSGESMPSVGLETPMSEAIIEISSKRLGIALVLDGAGALMGVITDGDLRRVIERLGPELFKRAAGDVMTRAPRTVAADDLAAKALALMEKHSITALPATGADGMPAGIIHLHDILKEGVV